MILRNAIQKAHMKNVRLNIGKIGKNINIQWENTAPGSGSTRKDLGIKMDAKLTESTMRRCCYTANCCTGFYLKCYVKQVK